MGLFLFPKIFLKTTLKNRVSNGLTKVFKIWDDDNDKNGDRPNAITVVLLKDGNAFRQAVLNEGNGWQHTFSDLKTAEAGKEIKYTIQELDVPEGYTASISGDVKNGFTIVNKRTTETPKTPSVKTPPSVETPKTGDDSNVVLWAVLALAALCGICAVMVRMRKKRNQNS